MKKTYTTPKSECVNLISENMIAASIGVSDTTIDAGNAFSNKKGGWSSDDWSGVEEEEF